VENPTHVPAALTAGDEKRERMLELTECPP